MSLKAGRVGVNPKDVDPVDGSIKPGSGDAYTKSQADAKFQDKLSVNNLTTQMELLVGTFTTQYGKNLLLYGNVIQCYLDFTVSENTASWSNMLKVPDSVTSGYDFMVLCMDVTAGEYYLASGVLVNTHHLQTSVELKKDHRYKMYFVTIKTT